ncbi:MAG TPA: hypothetical protein VG820_14065, partial [Fimbriimonadaceae bacterium]|nr:hypothetical protein [Fimbriimonadaceae bacterium]
ECGSSIYRGYACCAPACPKYEKTICEKCLKADGVRFRRELGGEIMIERDREAKIDYAASVLCPECERGRLKVIYSYVG